MPHITETLPESDQAIGRPVIVSVVKQLQQITKITTDPKIYFAGDSGRMHQAGSTIDDPSRDPVLASARRLIIEVDEDYDADSIFTTAVKQLEQIPIFYDQALGVVVRPVYRTTNVTINLEYKTFSKVEAKRWRDDLVGKLSEMRELNLHSVTYHFGIPAMILGLLRCIHSYREAVAGYGQNFETYMIENATARLTVIGNLKGEECQLVVGETQSRIIGMYDFDAVPEKPERDGDNAVWTVKFSYKFTYEKPIELAMRYPIMVHNQLLPKDYVGFTTQVYDLRNIPLRFPMSLEAMHTVEATTQISQVLDDLPYIPLPLFDDYALNSTFIGTGTIFLALCELSLPDQRLLLNLKDLGDIEIDSDIMEFLVQSEWPYLGKIYDSVFNLCLYDGYRTMGSQPLVCTQAMDVSSQIDLDPRHNWRVRFSIVTDLSLLSQAALDRLRRWPGILDKILEAINRILKNHPGWPYLGKRPYYSIDDMKRIVGLTRPPRPDPGVPRQYTVMLSSVVSFKRVPK